MPIIENWKLVVLQRYAKFDGRAGRAEFWWFALASIIINVAFNILGQVSGIFTILGFLFSLAVLLPSIGVAIRRLHDTDKTGLLLLLVLIPVIGWIILIVFYAQEGTAGPNKYGTGPEPAAATNTAAA